MRTKLSGKKKDNLLEVLELVKQYKTIRRAREIYSGSKKKFSECLDLLDSINVNPVTLPKRFERKRMDNLYKKLEQQYVTDKYVIYINL